MNLASNAVRHNLKITRPQRPRGMGLNSNNNLRGYQSLLCGCHCYIPNQRLPRQHHYNWSSLTCVHGQPKILVEQSPNGDKSIHSTMQPHIPSLVRFKLYSCNKPPANNWTSGVFKRAKHTRALLPATQNIMLSCFDARVKLGIHFGDCHA